MKLVVDALERDRSLYRQMLPPLTPSPQSPPGSPPPTSPDPSDASPR
jgi:hypothetical protein